MTGGEEEQKKGQGKGFAGLSSLVSDVDTTLPPAAKAEPTAAAPSTERHAQKAAQPQPSQHHQTYQEPAQPSSSGSSGGKWVLGIAAVIGVLWLIGQSDKSPTSPAPAYSPPAQTATPTYSPPAEPQAPSRQQESMPPVGQNLAFSTAQIRYCLAEDIRLEGAKSAVNNYIDSDVDRFNAMVADYNSRCGNFRHRRGTLESARRDVESHRGELQAEGRNRFARESGTGEHGAVLHAVARQTPDELAWQSILIDTLILRPGSVERELDSGVAIRAMAKSGHVSIKPDARLDYSDYRFLHKPAYFLGQEIIIIDEEYKQEWSGCCVNPGIALTMKIANSLDALRDFARKNKCAIVYDGDRYYGPKLPEAPNGTYLTLSCKESDAR